ncbi:hypothetical protein NL676_023212 [Syzygium grande]|nr:hypothetical protein NL676_023212 [Syzygium grande]
MVISSAPIVLPPLVVVSALGMAVSVPYGLFFASYAFSEKLMSTLLPNPYEEGIGVEEEEEEVGFGGDFYMEKDEVEQTEDIKEQLKMRFESVEGNEEEKTMVGDSYDKRGMVEDLSSEVHEIMEKDDDIIEGSLSKQPRDEMRGILLTLEVDENDDSKFDQIGVPLEVTNVVVLESRGLQNIGEDEPDKKVASLVVEEKKPIKEESEKMITDYGKEKTSTKVDAGRLKQGTSKGNVQENSLGIGDAKIPISLASSGLNDGRGLQILAGTGISPSFIEDQEIYAEEKIWQQIKVMRKIVGYKAKLQALCIEELKALYIFTGVEPAASFKDTLDLVEVSNKLQFLMSVVGVKYMECLTGFPKESTCSCFITVFVL